MLVLFKILFVYSFRMIKLYIVSCTAYYPILFHYWVCCLNSKTFWFVEHHDRCQFRLFQSSWFSHAIPVPIVSKFLIFTCHSISIVFSELAYRKFSKVVSFHLFSIGGLLHNSYLSQRLLHKLLLLVPLSISLMHIMRSSRLSLWSVSVAYSGVLINNQVWVKFQAETIKRT